MKYIDEFRDRDVAQLLVQKIARAADSGRSYNLMEFCGGHTHAIFRYGLLDLLPASVRMIHGPGCPVCVLPSGRLDGAIELTRRDGLILCTYGDMLRVPGSTGMSLLKARAEGADIRIVYSALDTIKVAQDNPHSDVVFFAIGFETTTPPTAVLLDQAQQLQLKNLSVYCNHVLTPAALSGILAAAEADSGSQTPLHGFVGPAHVSTVIGSGAFEPFARDYHRPVVVAGFEPLDILQAILMLVRQLNEQRCEVETEYARAVSPEGNVKAQALMRHCFELKKSFEWRGLGSLPNSALRIRETLGEFDAERRFSLVTKKTSDHPGCACGAVLRGAMRPVDCKLFGKACTPDSPIGSCMVSSEGACAAYYRYRRGHND